MRGLGPIEAGGDTVKVTIDNLDGAGAVDYSGALCARWTAEDCAFVECSFGVQRHAGCE